MRLRLKPLKQQVIVITGASSGIGLCTARMAAQRGARVVLAARNEQALRQICDEIEQAGGQAAYAAGDVAAEEDVERIAQVALDRFGQIDTWVNDAMVSIFGRLTEVPLKEHRRLFDTNYFGVVNGSLTAVKHLRERGGALINIGSVLSDRSIPFQSAYAASKFAVKGFTNALRMELEEEGLPISVTLIKPSSIDTPYYRVARNYLPHAPKNPPPVYDPSVAADAILYCAEHPRRDVYVGAGGPIFGLANILAPRLTDRYMEATMFRQQMIEDQPDGQQRHNLFEPFGDGEERGDHPNRVKTSSLTTLASLHPTATKVLLAGVALAAISLLRPRRAEPQDEWYDDDLLEDPMVPESLAQASVEDDLPADEDGPEPAAEEPVRAMHGPPVW